MKTGEKYQVDPLLVAALIKVESGFQKEAVSSQGARGLMQIMPETAEWVAETIGYQDFSPELLFQPEINIEIGTFYLADLLKVFEGNRTVALAASHGGRGKVSEWLNEGVWDGRLENLERIPYRETRDFVHRVLQTYTRYRQYYRNSSTNSTGERLRRVKNKEEEDVYCNVDQG